MVRLPGHRIAKAGEGVRPVDEPRHHHREPQVGVVGVRRAPILGKPARDAVVFSVDVSKGPIPQDLVVRPGLLLPSLALDPYRLALDNEGKQAGNVEGGAHRRPRRPASSARSARTSRTDPPPPSSAALRSPIPGTLRTI